MDSRDKRQESIVAKSLALGQLPCGTKHLPVFCSFFRPVWSSMVTTSHVWPLRSWNKANLNWDMLWVWDTHKTPRPLIFKNIGDMWIWYFGYIGFSKILRWVSPLFYFFVCLLENESDIHGSHLCFPWRFSGTPWIQTEDHNSRFFRNCCEAGQIDGGV